MQKLNSAYYQSSRTRIHDDFDTYAKSPNGLLTRANAIAFHRWACRQGKGEIQNPLEVLEVGVGTGAFAIGFLKELAKQDQLQHTAIAQSVRYTLADFSEPMLKRAEAAVKKNVPGAHVESLTLDAAEPTAMPLLLLARRYHLIRSNELYSDLPADVFVRIGDEISQVLYDSKMNTRRQPLPPNSGPLFNTRLPPAHSLSSIERSLMRRMPEGYFIPLPRKAAEAILALAAHLQPDGRIDLFDYGFYFADDFVLPPAIWNSTLVREFGGQWTVDFNFLYASLMLPSAGFRPLVSRQKEYVCGLLGEVELSDKLDYSLVGKKEKGAKDKKRPKSGPSLPDEREDDFFYHLQVQAGEE